MKYLGPYRQNRIAAGSVPGTRPEPRNFSGFKPC